MPNFGAVYILSYRALKWIAIGFGAFFIALSAFLRFTWDLKPGESHLVLLYPLLTGVALLCAGFLLGLNALRHFFVLWFVGLPAVFWLVNAIGCGMQFFSKGWCQ